MNLNKQIEQYFAKANLHKNSFLRTLPELKKVDELGKGLANINYLLTFNNGKKILMRFNFWKDKEWCTGNTISIKNEYQVLRYLEKYKIAPKAYFVDTSKKYFPFEFLLEEYISHENLQVDSDFVGVIETIKKLHEIKITDDGRKILNVDASKKKKVELYKQKLESIYAKRNGAIEKIFFEKENIYKQYLNTIEEAFIGDSIIHHDPFPENFLYKKHWYLIDWQTTAVGNPIHDVAYLLMDFIYQFTLGRKLTDTEKTTILKTYFKTENILEIKKKVEKLLPLYYIDLFLFLLYKENELTKQNFPKSLHSFLAKRLQLGRDIILKKKEILFWFSKMEKELN